MGLKEKGHEEWRSCLILQVASGLKSGRWLRVVDPPHSVPFWAPTFSWAGNHKRVPVTAHTPSTLGQWLFVWRRADFVTYFSLAALNIVSLCLVFISLISMCLGVFLFGFILYGTLCASWTWLTISFSFLGKFSTPISSNTLSYPFSFFSSSETTIIQMLVRLILSQRSLRLSSVLFILFTLFFSSELISTILSSSAVIRSSASDILLLIPSRVFLISVIVLFVSAYLFFNFSRSLLIYSSIFSILLSRFLLIFTIIILNYFSGSLPISSSFIWTSVFLVCSFICVELLCLFFFFFFLTYCV